MAKDVEGEVVSGLVHLSSCSGSTVVSGYWFVCRGIAAVRGVGPSAEVEQYWGKVAPFGKTVQQGGCFCIGSVVLRGVGPDLEAVQY